MLKNIGSNWALNAVQILVFMVLTPFVVDTLDRGPFGIWESILAVAGPLQLLILGVPMATVRTVSAHLARDEEQEARRALGTCVSIALVMGALTLVVGALIYVGFDAALLQSEKWDLSAAAITDARRAYWIFVANLAFGFCLRLPYAIFDAHHDFIPRNLVMASGFVIKLGLTVLLLSASATLTTLAWVQLLVAVIEFAAALAVSRARRHRVTFRPGGLEWRRVREILSFSIFALLLNMGAMLAFRIDAIVVGLFRDQDAVTTYALGNKIFDPFINLLLAIGMVVMPMATQLAATGAVDQVREVLLKWSKVAATLVLMLGVYLVVLGPEFLAWWFGGDYVPESGRLLQILMVSFFIFLPVRGVALPVLMGVGRPRKPAFGLLAMGLLNLALSVTLVGRYGVTGVALGTAIPNVLFASLFAVAACRELGVSPAEFGRYVAGRPLLGALPGAALLLAAKYWVGVEGLAPLVAWGLAFVVVFGAAQVLFVWRGDRYLDLGAKLAARLGRREGA